MKTTYKASVKHDKQQPNNIRIDLIHKIDKDANTFSIFNEKKKDAQEVHKKRLQNIKNLIDKREKNKKLLALTKAIQNEEKLDLIKSYAKQLEKLLKGM